MKLLIFTTVVCAVVAGIVALSRHNRVVAAVRADVGPQGVMLAPNGTLIDWDDIFGVTLLTRHRKLPPRTDFAFLLETERGPCSLSSRSGAAQRFLAECHRLPGFAHRSVVATLAEPRSQRTLCYRRGLA